MKWSVTKPIIDNDGKQCCQPPQQNEQLI